MTESEIISTAKREVENEIHKLSEIQLDFKVGSLPFDRIDQRINHFIEFYEILEKEEVSK